MGEDNNDIWFPVILKKQIVKRSSEGFARAHERDFYTYTVLENEEVVFYNRKTGEVKENKEIITNNK